MQEIEARISGSVHGVTYRTFAQKKARALWLNGYVKNVTGAGVYLVAQGSKEKLEKLIEHLWKGPFGCSVSNIDIVWRKPTETFKDFSIQY